MKEGYWVNYVTGKSFKIDEHELWIRRESNANRLGVSPEDVAIFDLFTPVQDRDFFLFWLLCNCSIMRVRGHGEYTSFEYGSSDNAKPLMAIRKLGDENAGDMTGFHIVNFGGPWEIDLLWHEIREMTDEAVLAASEPFEIKTGIKKRVERLSRELGL